MLTRLLVALLALLAVAACSSTTPTPAATPVVVTATPTPRLSATATPRPPATATPRPPATATAVAKATAAAYVPPTSVARPTATLIPTPTPVLQGGDELLSDQCDAPELTTYVVETLGRIAVDIERDLRGMGRIADKAYRDLERGTPEPAVILRYQGDGEGHAASFEAIAARIRAAAPPAVAAQIHAVMMDAADALDAAAHFARAGFAGDGEALTTAAGEMNYVGRLLSDTSGEIRRLQERCAYATIDR